MNYAIAFNIILGEMLYIGIVLIIYGRKGWLPFYAVPLAMLISFVLVLLFGVKVEITP